MKVSADNLSDQRDGEILVWYFRRQLDAIPQEFHPYSNDYQMALAWAQSRCWVLAYALGKRAGKRMKAKALTQA